MLLNGQNAKFYYSPPMGIALVHQDGQTDNNDKDKSFVLLPLSNGLETVSFFFTGPSEKLKATINLVISLQPSVGTVQLNSKCRDVLSPSYVGISTLGDTFRFWFKSYKDKLEIRQFRIIDCKAPRSQNLDVSKIPTGINYKGVSKTWRCLVTCSCQTFIVPFNI